MNNFKGTTIYLTFLEYVELVNAGKIKDDCDYVFIDEEDLKRDDYINKFKIDKYESLIEQYKNEIAEYENKNAEYKCKIKFMTNIFIAIIVINIINMIIQLFAY